MRQLNAFMVMLIVPGVLSIEAAAPPEDTVAVRTYNYASVSLEQLGLARSEATQIFKRSRISIEWADCRVPGAVSGSACTDPLLARRDLMLRLMDRPPSDDRFVALGESMLDHGERRGVLMTIDMWTVRAIADRAGMPMPTLLGRAIAHEIGHLLLGSGTHPRIGLMRARWSNDELRGLKPAHWGFSTREAAQMRQALRGTSRTAD
jgi:hypothetical protein